MNGLDAHIDRQQAAHTDAEDDREARQEIREAAVEEMLAELIAGRDVTYGQRVINKPEGGVRVAKELITADDVRDEIDGESLRAALGFGFLPWYPARALWMEAAREVCERHVDEYLEWRATI